MKKHLFLFAIAAIFAACTKMPTAEFSYSGSTEAPATIQFKNNSQNADNYLWRFGDGVTSELDEPQHIYEWPGDYEVMLTAYGEGSAAAVNTITITGTTYYVANKSSFDLDAVVSYYYNGTDIVDFVEHGAMNSGSKSDTVLTKRALINLGIVMLGEVYIITDDYYINENELNELQITNESHIYGGSKKEAITGIDPEKLEHLLTKLKEKY